MKLISVNPTHAPVLYEWRAQPHMNQFNHIVQRSVSELKTMLARCGGDLSQRDADVYQWMMEVDSVFVGLMSLRIASWHDGVAEIGYSMDVKTQGRGLCSQAVHLALEKAFLEGGLRRITATAACDNVASWKVLEKNHFLREGLLRAHHVVGGYPRDYYSYGLLKDEFTLASKSTRS